MSCGVRRYLAGLFTGMRGPPTSNALLSADSEPESFSFAMLGLHPLRPQGRLHLLCRTGNTMARFTLSIRTRLTLYVLAFVAIIAGMALIGVFSLRSVDLRTKEIDQKWLAGTALLSEIAERIAEYRIVEGYRALATQPKVRAQAELLADGERNAIQSLQSEYLALLGGGMLTADLDSFDLALNHYFLAHDAWVKRDVDGQWAEPVRYEGSLDQFYKAADASIDTLIAADRSAAHTQAAAVDNLTDGWVILGVVVSFISTVLACWLLVRIRSQITRPLGAITRALSELAAGSREVRVPGLHRADEIGAMATAFEVFRTNALALEKAHEATRAAQDHAHSVARHDALTGLPNRRVFSAELQTLLNRGGNRGLLYSVLLIGLDQFKQVNDLRGHPAGDKVLREVACRIKDTVGRRGTAARLGGDEFAVIMDCDGDERKQSDGAVDLAGRVLEAIRRPILIGETEIKIGASIGIALQRPDHSDAGSLLRSADIAMYRAKRDTRGSIRFFEQRMDEDLLAQASLEADLKSALANWKIRPHYQPLVKLRTNRLCGFEALARWEHPERGFVPPALFVPLVEQLGLMADLTSLILRQVCRDAKEWPAEIRIAVNISPSELKDPLLPDRLLTILAEEGFDPARLDVEITESALICDIQTAKSVLATFRSAGIQISLDDFGTGYSSLYHLRELKFDKVKIDRSFIQSMLDNPESEKIVDAILGLTKNLDLSVVAEGIENPAILLRLAAKGCEFGQGYYFGKAMTAASATDMLLKEIVAQSRIVDTRRTA
jgi:diguanylate cyclase (GGDEF)-like protein